MKLNALLFIVIFINQSCIRESEKSDSGFKFVIECTIPSSSKIEILEEDIIKVDWSKQEYYLKENKINGKEFNNKVCFGGCKMKAVLNGVTEYETVLYCDIAPNNLSTKNNRNTIFIKAGEDRLNLFFENRLQLNLNAKRRLTDDKDKQSKISNFLFSSKIESYLKGKSLLIRE